LDAKHPGTTIITATVSNILIGGSPAQGTATVNVP
jgi:hypothetical protein